MKNSAFVSMGKPVKAPVLIPVKHSATPNCINEPFWVDGDYYRVTCVSFGTPHGIVFVDDLENTDVSHIGKSLGTHSLFPEGADIVFAKMIDKTQIKARVWKREKGEAPYSEEAACAAMTAAKMLQKADCEADVSMGDKTFRVKWKGVDDEVYYSDFSD